MAALTRAAMVDKVLHRLRTLGAGQSANANDAQLVGEALDDLHARYARKGKAPFPTSAFPVGLQEVFARLIAKEVAPYFGLGTSPTVRAEFEWAEVELNAQMQGKIHALTTKIKAW